MCTYKQDKPQVKQEAEQKKKGRNPAMQQVSRSPSFSQLHRAVRLRSHTCSSKGSSVLLSPTCITVTQFNFTRTLEKLWDSPGTYTHAWDYFLDFKKNSRFYAIAKTAAKRPYSGTFRGKDCSLFFPFPVAAFEVINLLPQARVPGYN